MPVWRTACSSGMADGYVKDYERALMSVSNDSCGLHSRPYHSCVIACLMQVREEHAMGHDSGDILFCRLTTELDRKYAPGCCME